MLSTSANAGGDSAARLRIANSKRRRTSRPSNGMTLLAVQLALELTSRLVNKEASK